MPHLTQGCEARSMRAVEPAAQSPTRKHPAPPRARPPHPPASRQMEREEHPALAAVGVAAPGRRRGPTGGREAGASGTEVSRCGLQRCPVTPRPSPRAERSEHPCSRARRLPHATARLTVGWSCAAPEPWSTS